MIQAAFAPLQPSQRARPWSYQSIAPGVAVGLAERAAVPEPAERARRVRVPARRRLLEPFDRRLEVRRDAGEPVAVDEAEVVVAVDVVALGGFADVASARAAGRRRGSGVHVVGAELVHRRRCARTRPPAAAAGSRAGGSPRRVRGAGARGRAREGRRDRRRRRRAGRARAPRAGPGRRRRGRATGRRRWRPGGRARPRRGCGRGRGPARRRPARASKSRSASWTRPSW